MEVKEFIKIVKEELPDFLPEEVYQDLVIDDVEIMRDIRKWRKSCSR